MTIDELYQAFDNVTMLTRFYIVNSEGKILAWGSTYHELLHENRTLSVVHFKYDNGEIIIWV